MDHYSWTNGIFYRKVKTVPKFTLVTLTLNQRYYNSRFQNTLQYTIEQSSGSSKNRYRRPRAMTQGYNPSYSGG
jgi:hypothetical protein